MINDFLFRLVNDPAAASGQIPKPGGAMTAYTGARAVIQNCLLASANRRDRFKAAVALTTMLRHSMLAGYELKLDKRITYTDDDLAAEIIGGTDSVVCPVGVTATYAATAATPSEESWLISIPATGKISALSSIGIEKADVTFSATAAVAVSLKLGAITLSVVGVPAVGSQIVINRRAKYSYGVTAALSRLALANDNTTAAVVPAELQRLLRTGFVAKNTTRLLAAAIGVAYGQS